MAELAEQQTAPVEPSEAIEGVAVDPHLNVLSDVASGRAVSASPDLGVEQQRPRGDLLAADLAAEDGAARPPSTAAPETFLVPVGRPLGLLCSRLHSPPP